MWYLQLLEKPIRWVKAAAGEEMLRRAGSPWLASRGVLSQMKRYLRCLCKLLSLRDPPAADNYFDLLSKSPFQSLLPLQNLSTCATSSPVETYPGCPCHHLVLQKDKSRVVCFLFIQLSQTSLFQSFTEEALYYQQGKLMDQLVLRWRVLKTKPDGASTVWMGWAWPWGVLSGRYIYFHTLYWWLHNWLLKSIILHSCFEVITELTQIYQFYSDEFRVPMFPESSC